MKYKINNEIYNTRKEARRVSKHYERIPENICDNGSIKEKGR